MAPKTLSHKKTFTSLMVGENKKRLDLGRMAIPGLGKTEMSAVFRFNGRDYGMLLRPQPSRKGTFATFDTSSVADAFYSDNGVVAGSRVVFKSEIEGDQVVIYASHYAASGNDAGSAAERKTERKKKEKKVDDTPRVPVTHAQQEDAGVEAARLSLGTPTDALAARRPGVGEENIAAVPAPAGGPRRGPVREAKVNRIPTATLAGHIVPSEAKEEKLAVGNGSKQAGKLPGRDGNSAYTLEDLLSATKSDLEKLDQAKPAAEGAGLISGDDLMGMEVEVSNENDEVTEGGMDMDVDVDMEDADDFLEAMKMMAKAAEPAGTTEGEGGLKERCEEPKHQQMEEHGHQEIMQHEMEMRMQQQVEAKQRKEQAEVAVQTIEAPAQQQRQQQQLWVEVQMQKVEAPAQLMVVEQQPRPLGSAMVGGVRRSRRFVKGTGMDSPAKSQAQRGACQVQRCQQLKRPFPVEETLTETVFISSPDRELLESPAKRRRHV